METDQIKSLSNQSLLLILSHKNLYDKSLCENAKRVFDSREMNEFEIDLLIQSQEAMVSKLKDLIGDRDNDTKVASIFKENEISKELIPAFRKNLKPSNKMTVLAFIFFVIIFLRFILRHR